MRNRILSIFAHPIPYVPALREIVGSVTAAILMQQLDYWFSRYPDGFYKYLEPCGSCNSGDSWTEELGFSKGEFRRAFDNIGTRYDSKGMFDSSEDKFRNKFYASYHNKITGKTYYVRNHKKLDLTLDQLSNTDSNSEGESTEVTKCDLRRSQNVTYVDHKTLPTDLSECDLHIAEITTEITTEIRSNCEDRTESKTQSEKEPENKKSNSSVERNKSEARLTYADLNRALENHDLAVDSKLAEKTEAARALLERQAERDPEYGAFLRVRQTLMDLDSVRFSGRTRSLEFDDKARKAMSALLGYGFDAAAYIRWFVTEKLPELGYGFSWGLASSMSFTDEFYEFHRSRGVPRSPAPTGDDYERRAPTVLIID